MASIKNISGLVKHDRFMSYKDVDPEKFYLFVFPDQGFPDRFSLYKAHKDIFKYFEQNKDFSLLVCSSSAEEDDEDMNETLSSSQPIPYTRDRDISIFVDYSRKLLVFIKTRSRDSVNAYIVSTDRESVNSLGDMVSKKFSIQYDEEVVRFGVLYDTGYGIEVEKIPLLDKDFSNFDVALNYGESFVESDKIIIDKLKNNKQNLFLLHGCAGTGKTTFIKSLAKRVKEKTFIFIPPQYVESLVSPKLIPILLSHKNSVLVLEDAEKAIVSRENGEGNESLVSSILNLSDGILGAMLNISFIITFNTQKNQIDKAILRKGRLSYEKEFKPLPIEEAQRLLDKLNKKHTATEPMTLADIYNVDADIGRDNSVEPERSIGFKVS